MLRVLVVTDEKSLDSPVRSLLGPEPDIEIIGTLAFDSQLTIRAAELWPMVILIDTQYMVSQVLPIAAELRARIPFCSLLLLCDPTKPGMLPPRQGGGDLSFLVKGASGPLLAAAIRRLAAGERIMHPRLQVASLNIERELSTRELEVLGLAAEGDSVADIAGRLHLSGGTVRNYLSAVISKTGARNRLDAIRIVRNEGWLR